MLPGLAPSRGGHPVRVAVDITGLSRDQLGEWYGALVHTDVPGGMIVDFVYTPAAYASPSVQVGASHTGTAKPIHPRFAGWVPEADRHTVAIVGLGLDGGLEFGLLEELEPAEIWAFLPTGDDLRYEEAVRTANRFVLSQLPDTRVLRWRVDSPFDCFLELESLVYGRVHDSRPVIVASGPKLFALVALLVASAHAPRVAVWRVDASLAPADSGPVGVILGLRTRVGTYY